MHAANLEPTMFLLLLFLQFCPSLSSRERTRISIVHSCVYVWRLFEWSCPPQRSATIRSRRIFSCICLCYLIHGSTKSSTSKHQTDLSSPAIPLNLLERANESVYQSRPPGLWRHSKTTEQTRNTKAHDEESPAKQMNFTQTNTYSLIRQENDFSHSDPNAQTTNSQICMRKSRTSKWKKKQLRLSCGERFKRDVKWRCRRYYPFSTLVICQEASGLDVQDAVSTRDCKTQTPHLRQHWRLPTHLNWCQLSPPAWHTNSPLTTPKTHDAFLSVTITSKPSSCVSLANRVNHSQRRPRCCHGRFCRTTTTSMFAERTKSGERSDERDGKQNDRLKRIGCRWKCCQLESIYCVLTKF